MGSWGGLSALQALQLTPSLLAGGSWGLGLGEAKAGPLHLIRQLELRLRPVVLEMEADSGGF